MAAQSQPQRGVVKKHLFTFTRSGQQQNLFCHGSRAQQTRCRPECRSLPDLLAPVARQTQQRIGTAERLEITLVELRAQGQVFGTAERARTARRHDALRRSFNQAADHAQAQTDNGLGRAVIPDLALVIPDLGVVIPDLRFVIPDLIRDPVPHIYWIADQVRNDSW